jgi:hypothetical protein
MEYSSVMLTHLVTNRFSLDAHRRIVNLHILAIFLGWYGFSRLWLVLSGSCFSRLNIRSQS